MTAGPVSKSIQKLLFYKEPNRAAYGVDHSGTLGDYVLIPTMEGSIDYDPGVVMVDPGQTVHHIHDWREKFVSHKSWTLSFQTPLAPTGVAAGDGVPAVAGPAAELLSVVGGGIAIGEGTTVSVTWSDGISGALTDVSTLAPGMALGFVINGRLYMREIKSISGSTVALKVALPAAPQATDVVYGGVTIYLARNPQASAQFLVIGEEEDDRYIFRGGWGTVSIELVMTGEGEPMLSFEFQGRRWDYGEDGATDLSLEAFEPEEYVRYSPISDHAGEFIEQAVGTSALATAPVKAMTWNLTLENRPITDPSAEEGVRHWLRVRANGPTIAGDFTPSFYEDLTRQKRRDNKDDMYLAYGFGTSIATGGVLLTASRVQYTASPPGESDAVGVEVTQWEGRNDSDTVEATPTDLGLSCFRIHFIG